MTVMRGNLVMVEPERRKKKRKQKENEKNEKKNKEEKQRRNRSRKRRKKKSRLQHPQQKKAITVMYHPTVPINNASMLIVPN